MYEGNKREDKGTLGKDIGVAWVTKCGASPELVLDRFVGEAMAACASRATPDRAREHAYHLGS